MLLLCTLKSIHRCTTCFLSVFAWEDHTSRGCQQSCIAQYTITSYTITSCLVSSHPDATIPIAPLPITLHLCFQNRNFLTSVLQLVATLHIALLWHDAIDSSPNWSLLQAGVFVANRNVSPRGQRPLSPRDQPAAAASPQGTTQFYPNPSPIPP